jgi:hypothetical protein
MNNLFRLKIWGLIKDLIQVAHYVYEIKYVSAIKGWQCKLMYMHSEFFYKM